MEMRLATPGKVDGVGEGPGEHKIRIEMSGEEGAVAVAKTTYALAASAVDSSAARAAADEVPRHPSAESLLSRDSAPIYPYLAPASTSETGDGDEPDDGKLMPRSRTPPPPSMSLPPPHRSWPTPAGRPPPTPCFPELRPLRRGRRGATGTAVTPLAAPRGTPLAHRPG